MPRFTDKVVLVTGGTTGIGRATAAAFAREGAKVVISGRREKEGQEAARAIRAEGGEIHFVQADVSREDDVKRMVAETVQKYGRLDIAFNNAGVEQAPTSIVDQTEADYDLVMDVNVKGVFFSLKHEIPAILKSGGGSIVNTTSVAGLVNLAGVPAYVASKHAVIGLTKSAAIEFAKQNIRVNAVAPAAIETPMIDRFLEHIPREAMNAMHPIGRLGKPDEIASGVLWLSDPTASFVTGHTLTIDGGVTAT